MRCRSCFLVAVALLVLLLKGTPQARQFEPILRADFAQAHSEVANMLICPVSLDELPGELKRPSQAYFDAPVPHIIHQIWFGEPAIFDDERSDDWQALAAGYDYDYHLWTEQDDPIVERLFGADVLAHVKRLRSNKHYTGASDVLRYHLMERFGGMYFDNDVIAPRHDGHLLDPAELWPMKGLVTVGENDVREVDNGAFYIVNGILIASQNHPVISAMTKAVMVNWRARPDYAETREFNPIYIMGQSLLTAQVQGQFTMLPLPYMESLGMYFWPELKSYRENLREKFAAREHQPAHITSIHPPAFSE